MSEGLKPCPFCGNEAELTVSSTDLPGYENGICYSASCQGKINPDCVGSQNFQFKTQAWAIEEWNKRGGWMPIETCPPWTRVLLMIPKFESWDRGEWIGIRESYPRDRIDEVFKIATPFSQNGKQVYATDIPKPTHWMPLPEPPTRQEKEA